MFCQFPPTLVFLPGEKSALSYYSVVARGRVSQSQRQGGGSAACSSLWFIAVIHCCSGNCLSIMHSFQETFTNCLLGPVTQDTKGGATSLQLSQCRGAGGQTARGKLSLVSEAGPGRSAAQSEPRPATPMAPDLGPGCEGQALQRAEQAQWASLKGKTRQNPKSISKSVGRWGLQAGRGEVYSSFLG